MRDDHGDHDSLGSLIDELRRVLHSSHFGDRTSQQAAAPEQVRRSADLRAQLIELGEEALASGDEQMAARALRLHERIRDMDRGHGLRASG